MRPNIIAFIYILLCLTSTTAFGTDLNKLLQEHMEYNERTNGSGNYFIYYSPEFATSPTTPLFTTDWLKEDPMGIMPLAQTLRDVLLKYNTEPYEDDEINYTGKIQHYVVVIDLTYYNKTLVDVFTQKIKESFGLKGSTKFQDFDTQVKARETEEIKTFPVAATFEPNAKILVTFAFVHKVVVNDIVKAEVRLTYGVSKQYPYEKITNYIAAAREKFNAEKDSSTTKGLNIIITDVYYFIEKIWENPSPRIACLDQIGEIASTIASEFIEQRCTLAGENADNKYALLRSAQFIELLRYCKDNSSNSILSNDVIGDISVNYFPWLDLFLLPYFQEPEPKQPYDLWLRDHYKLYQPSNATLNNYHNVYFEYFFVTDQPEYDDLKEILITSLQHYDGVHETPEEILAKFNPFKNWRFNRSFNNVFKWTNTGNYTQSERSELYSILTQYPTIQSILYNWILNPGPGSIEIPLLGPSSLEIARNMVPLITEFNQSPTPEYEPENTVPIKVGLPMFTIRIENPQIYQGYKDQIVTTLVNNQLKFDLSICRANCNTTDGFINCNDCIEILGTHSKTVNFFDNVYSVIIHHPGYNELCEENTELNVECKNLISFEPAFFTVTKVRQEQFDEFIQDVSLDIALITLPFSFAEFTATQAAGLGARALHGIWLSSDVLSLFTENEANFNALCNSVFGEQLGQSISSKIILINGLVQLSQLGSTLSSTKYLKTVNDPNFSSEAAAIQKYLEEYKLHTGQDLPKLDNESTISLGNHIKKDYTASVGADAEPIIKIKHAELYGLNRPVDYILSADKENLRKLINRCRHKTSTFDPPPTTGQKRIHEVLNSLDETELDLLISDLNSLQGESLIEFFQSATDATQMERGLDAWRSLKYTPEGVRRNAFNTEMVKRHIDETSKTPATISAEINQSGNFDEWLSDYFVTYIKAGFKIDKASIDTRFANHVNVVESVTSATASGVIGGHNRTAFMAELYDPVNAPTKRVVLEGTESSNGIPGFSLAQYKTYQVDGSGNLIFPLQFNGSPAAVKSKTLFDPALWTAANLKELAYKGYKNAIDNGTYSNIDRSFYGFVDNYKVVGHYFEDVNGNTISTWWLETP